MKAIMISIKPKYVADILNHKKTIEIRKSMPKCDLPVDVYIYCTKEDNLFKSWIKMGFTTERTTAYDLDYNGKGKVVAKFTLNNVEEISYNYRSDFTSVYTDTIETDNLEERACLTRQEFREYLNGNIGYAWHISNLVIFDKPKELSEFSIKVFPHRKNNLMTRYLTKAPQSWCYVEELL